MGCEPRSEVSSIAVACLFSNDDRMNPLFRLQSPAERGSNSKVLWLNRNQIVLFTDVVWPRCLSSMGKDFFSVFLQRDSLSDFPA